MPAFFLWITLIKPAKISTSWFPHAATINMDFWNTCLQHFEQKLPRQQFQTWIKPLKASHNANGGYTLVAPNRFTLQWIRDNFLEEIQQLAQKQLGENAGIQLTLEEKPVNQETLRVTVVASSIDNHKTILREDSHLNPDYSFDSLVVGKANEFARAAATQVAERPGIAYNPLFIHGGVGLGKTHLAHAIGNAVLERSPESKVRYIRADEYVEDVIRAYQQKKFDDLKSRYRSLDLLIIDDVQLFGIGNKSRTQEEFFYAFDALVRAQKQIVITSDASLTELAGIESRLVSRFNSGLPVAVDPPELEMRIAILSKKAETAGIVLEQEVAFFIASNVQSDVRSLEGALKRVLASANLRHQPISIELSREVLKDILSQRSRQISIDNIQKTVADYYNIKVSEMYSKKRSRNVARPRQIAMALARELTQKSLPDIGEAFGGRDHTTVLHACKIIAALKTSNQEITKDFNSLLKTLRG